MHHNQRAAIDSTTRHIELVFYREREIKRAVRLARENVTGGHSGGSNGHCLCIGRPWKAYGWPRS